MDASRHTILVVEDDSLYLDLISGSLGLEFPHAVILAAESGEMALELLAQHRVNLVITDLCMPGIDGFELLIRVKELAPQASTFVISSFEITDARDLARNLGMRLFLEKPIDFDTLSHAVSEVLGAPSGDESIVHGFNLASFLQLMELDQKTGTLRIFADAREGELCFKGGRLTYAVTQQKSGNAALFEILGWPSPEIRISGSCQDHLPNITESLSSLLLEGFHTLDENVSLACSTAESDSKQGVVEEGESLWSGHGGAWPDEVLNQRSSGL